jgi:hypothetical protein
VLQRPGPSDAVLCAAPRQVRAQPAADSVAGLEPDTDHLIAKFERSE